MLLLAAPAGTQAATQQMGGPSDTAIPRTRAEIQLSFAPLVRRAAPAVVSIFTTKIVRARRYSPLFDDPFFRRFFGKRLLIPGPTVPRKQKALGSGVIVDEAGIIVTNNHVIEGADKIMVVLSDRREFKAEIIGTDEPTDLAVLRIDTHGEKLPFLAFGDSDALEVGDLVLAIGNPFGVGQTVTSGIVSALARTRIGVGDFRSFIQTDAAINPGNSGGALIDMKGRLIGVNTAIFTRTGGSLGIGFAIPANMVQVVLRSAVSKGRVVRPWLGASGQTVTAEIAESLSMKRPTGVIIKAVNPSSPAAKAGLRLGDVVAALNGREVNDANVLRFRLAMLPVGKTATLTVLRHGQKLSLKVDLVPPPEVPPRNLTELTGRQPLAGATVANLSPAYAEELGLDDTLTGVIIAELAPGSPAQRFGFRPGDIVLQVSGAKATRVAKLKRLLGVAARSWRIRVNRRGRVISGTFRM